METAILPYELDIFFISQSTSVSAPVRGMPAWQVVLMRNVRRFRLGSLEFALTTFFRKHFPMLEEIQVRTARRGVPGNEPDEHAWLLELGAAVEVKDYGSHSRFRS